MAMLCRLMPPNLNNSSCQTAIKERLCRPVVLSGSAALLCGKSETYRHLLHPFTLRLRLRCGVAAIS